MVGAGVAKLQKLACARTVACAFGVHMWESKHTTHDRCMSQARSCFTTLGLSHYTYGVTTDTVTVGNEIQLLCS